MNKPIFKPELIYDTLKGYALSELGDHCWDEEKENYDGGYDGIKALEVMKSHELSLYGHKEEDQSLYYSPVFQMFKHYPTDCAKIIVKAIENAPDPDSLKEQAMEAGMMHGLGAYNEIMGSDCDNDYYEENYR